MRELDSWLTLPALLRSCLLRPSQSTSNRSVTEYALDMERHVSNLSCHMGRETTLYQAHFPATSLSPVLSLVSDSMLHPLLTPEEVTESILAANYELQLYDEKTDSILIEVLQDVAFGGKALGRPNLPEPEKVAVQLDDAGDVASVGLPAGTEGEITSEKLQAFREKFYRPERIVVAGTGMDHDLLVRLTQEQFGHLGAPSIKDAHSTTSVKPPTSTSGSSWIPNIIAPFLSTSSQTQQQQATKAFATLSSPAPADGEMGIGLPRSVYTGGIRIEEREEMENSHVFIGFEGVDANDEDVVSPLCCTPEAIVQRLMIFLPTCSTLSPSSRCCSEMEPPSHQVRRLAPSLPRDKPLTGPFASNRRWPWKGSALSLLHWCDERLIRHRQRQLDQLPFL
jgi:processing peptidase subunit alpha